MILTVRTAASPLPPPPAWIRQQDQRSVASLVVCIHYVEKAGNAGEKHRHGWCCVCVCVTGTCCVVSIGSHISLAIERKPSWSVTPQQLMLQMIIWRVWRSCNTDCLLSLMHAWADVAVWDSGGGDSQTVSGTAVGLFDPSAMVIIGGRAQHCTVTCGDGQILNKMSCVGLWRNC